MLGPAITIFKETQGHNNRLCPPRSAQRPPSADTEHPESSQTGTAVASADSHWLTGLTSTSAIMWHVISYTEGRKWAEVGKHTASWD